MTNKVADSTEKSVITSNNATGTEECYHTLCCHSFSVGVIFVGVCFAEADKHCIIMRNSGY
jgi:hypothetical protein